MDRPRLTIEISEELYERARRLIPWGTQALIMRNLLSRALDVIEEHGELGLGAMISGQITIFDLLKKGGRSDNR